MGYSITQMDCKFFIAGKDKKACLEACKKDENLKDACKNIKSLEQLFSSYYYEPENEKADIIGLTFEGEKLSYSEMELFNVIAPYVKDGSYIQMMGEDGSMWRWVFDGKECNEISPTITW